MSNEFAEFQTEYESAQNLERFSRRSLFLGGAALAGVVADVTLTNHLQRERSRVEIAEISDDETRERFPNNLWLIAPGFKMGWDDSRRIAESLEPTMRQRGRIAYIGYSNKGLDTYELKTRVNSYIEQEDIQKVYLYGHSFGGMVATELAHHLQRDTDVDSALIALDSSPSSQFDVKAKAELHFLSLLENLHVPIPTAGRAAYELGERTVNKDERSLSDIWHQSLEQLYPGAPSSQLIKSEAAYIEHFDPREFPLASRTDVAMLANMADETVNISSATKHWSEYLKDAFKEVYWTNGARPAHASPFWNEEIYNHKLKILQATLLPLGYYRYRKFY